METGHDYIMGWYNLDVLPELSLEDVIRLRKPHPCGSTDWKVVRLGADIGLVCCGCSRRIMLSRRELSRRFKILLSRGADEAKTI
jgi:hypothetical protein